MQNEDEGLRITFIDCLCVLLKLIELILGLQQIVELELVGEVEQVDDVAVGEDEFGGLDGRDEIFYSELEGLSKYKGLLICGLHWYDN